MSDEKKTPKSGRKGGAVYPRIDLKQAVEYARKLVSKTHTGAQPASVVLPGVFGSATNAGKIRASALKQFGLLDGTPKAYNATELARSINAAPPEDLPQLLRPAFMNVSIFKAIFMTFCDDTVTTARIRQHCSTLKIHPDSADHATELFVKSALFAGLITVNGDNISFVAHSAIPTDDSHEGEPTDAVGSKEEESNDEGESDDLDSPPPDDRDQQGSQPPSRSAVGNRANIEIRIDPSMDPEKLEKLLSVLKRYRQI